MGTHPDARIDTETLPAGLVDAKRPTDRGKPAPDQRRQRSQCGYHRGDTSRLEHTESQHTVTNHGAQRSLGRGPPDPLELES